MMITGSDAFNEGLQRASNARELYASCACQKHDKMECIFFETIPENHAMSWRLPWHCPLREKYPA